MVAHSNDSPKVEVTAQQSRFHSATIDPTGTTEIDLIDVNISIGDRELLSHQRIHLQDGVKYALLGRNGTGKSTLLNAISTRLIPGISPSLKICLVSQLGDEEELATNPAGAKTNTTSVLDHVLSSYTEREKLLKIKQNLEKALSGDCDPQIAAKLYLEVMRDKKAVELYEAQLVALRRSGARGKDARAEEIRAEEALRDAEKQFSEVSISSDWATRAMDILAETDLELDMIDSDAIAAKGMTLLKGLGFSDSMIQGPYSALSGGWKSRCRLALALLIHSDVLFLDEASNFLDLEAIIWLQRHLKSLTQTIVLISHDQAFLDAIVDETIVLRQQALKYFPGTPTAMQEAEEKDRLGKEKQQAALDKKKEHIEATIAEGKKSAKQTGDDNRLKMVKTRTKKLNERWGAETSAKGTRFKLNRDMAGYALTSRAAIQIEEVEQEVKMKLPEAAEIKTVGDLIHLERATLGYGKNVLLESVTMTMSPGDRVALVGKNGKGKSTIAKAITGQLAPICGEIRRHPQLKIGYFDQHSVEELAGHAEETPLRVVVDHLEGMANPITAAPTSGSTEMAARSALGRFGLSGKVASHTLVRALSGGQRVRLALALLFSEPRNLLILDEVTTHLDGSTINALASALKEWKGCILLITHDRSFCDSVIGDLGSHSRDEADKLSTTKKGRVFLVKKAGLELLEKGISEYERRIERRLVRQRVAG